MITIDSYDITQPSMFKTWKAEFRQFLIDYYEPSLVNAENVFKAVGNVDLFIKKYTDLNIKLLQVKEIDSAKRLRDNMLTHRPFAMGPTISANDYKVIAIDRYIEFISIKQDTTKNTNNTTQQIAEEDEKATEGLIREIRYFRSKRNRAIRNRCAERDHYTCQVCGLNFEKVYGERGKGFIEIHHKKPMASYEGEHEIQLEDLIALCSNCHSMIHHGRVLLSPEELIISMNKQIDKNS